MNISQELRMLRETLEKMPPGSGNPPADSASPGAAENNASIVLDLAAYVQKRQDKERN